MNNSRQNLVIQAEKIIENYSKKADAVKKNRFYRTLFLISAGIVFVSAACFYFWK